MIRLLLLGGVRLTDADGRDIRAVLQQPKRLAVLAYLATARPRNAQRRDSLVALFWPELSEERARASLSQALYFLRNNTDPNLVAELGRERVGLSHGAVWCDVVEFEGLLEAGQVEEALRLYDGDFMRGLHISDAPEWEKWLDEERERLRKLAVGAAWELATREEAAGHAGLAVHWASWAAGMNPLDESGHRFLLELLDRTGDRGRALRTHDEWTKRLWLELEVEPAEETLRLVETIRAKTYRGVERRSLGQGDRSETPARRGSSAVEWVPAESAAAERTERRRRPVPQWLHRRVQIAAVLALLVTTAAATAIWRGDVSRGAAVSSTVEQPLSRVAILPFRNVTAEGDVAYFAEGLTATLTDRLAQVDQISVVSANSTRQFSSLSPDSIGRALNVGAIVAGTVAQSAGVIRVVVELIDARTAVTLSTETLERPQDDVLRLLDDMASAVAWMLRTELGQQIELREIARETNSREAWELVARARQLRAEANDRAAIGDREGGTAALLRAIELLSDAREIDDSFVHAYVEQSGVYELRAIRSAARDRPAAIALLDSAFTISSAAVELNPQSAEALEQRGNTLFLQWVFSGGARDTSDLLARAEADLRAALRIHPKRARAEARLSQILYQRGEFAQAYYAASRAYASDAYATRIEDVVWRLFETAFEIGREDEAGKWCDELRRRAPETWLHRSCTMILLGFGTDGTGDPRKALLAYDAAMREVTDDHRDVVMGELTALLAASYARAGEADSARVLLARVNVDTDLRVLALSAAVRAQLGETDSAIEMLGRYLEIAPTHRQRIKRSRFFAALDSAALAALP